MATALKGKGKGKEKGNIGSFEMYPSTVLLAPQVYTKMKSSRFASSVQICLRIALLLFSSSPPRIRFLMQRDRNPFPSNRLWHICKSQGSRNERRPNYDY